MNGILRPSEEKVHEIKMIFDSDVPRKDTLAMSFGTFVLCKGVYNARKVIETAWDKETSTLTVIIDLSREKIRPKRPAQFSFNIQINDCNTCKAKVVNNDDFFWSVIQNCAREGYCSKCDTKSLNPASFSIGDIQTFFCVTG